MMYRLFWFEDTEFYTVDIDAASESAARQAWIEGNLPRATPLGGGYGLRERGGREVEMRLFNVVTLTGDPAPYDRPPTGPATQRVPWATEPHHHTVRSFIAALLDAEDLDAKVFMQDHLGWFAHVGHVALPTDDDGHLGVTIYLGDTWP